jgi:gluconolactonase
MNLHLRAALSIFLLLPMTALTQDAPAGGRGGSGGGAGRGGAPQPFMIIRLDPALDSVIAPDAKPDTIATIPGIGGEGPMWREGKLWVSDQHAGGSIYAVTMDGKATVMAENAGGPNETNGRGNRGPNGEVTDKDGSVIFCRQAFRDLGRLNADGTVSVFLANYDGKKFNSPNDLVFGPDGALWFTDPPFALPGFSMGRGGAAPGATPVTTPVPGAAPAAPAPPAASDVPSAREIPFNGVFRYKDGKVTAVITDMNLPNGIGLSPDGKILYVNNSAPDPVVKAWDVGKDDSLSNQRILIDFAHLPPDVPATRGGVPDGLKVDSLGNVWTTGPGGINIVSPQGKLLGRIQLPMGASNMAFGEDLHSIFFTSGATIYRLHTIAAGEKPLYYRP